MLSNPRSHGLSVACAGVGRKDRDALVPSGMEIKYLLVLMLMLIFNINSLFSPVIVKYCSWLLDPLGWENLSLYPGAANCFNWLNAFAMLLRISPSSFHRYYSEDGTVDRDNPMLQPDGYNRKSPLFSPINSSMVVLCFPLYLRWLSD